MELTSVIESLLIASEDPLPSSEIARIIRASVDEMLEELKDQGDEKEAQEEAGKVEKFAEIKEEEVTLAINSLNEDYEKTGRAFLCLERAKGWKIFTRPEHAHFIQHLFPGKKPAKLSAPAMETLAIIAYRQPITKASIEVVRGVSCDGMLHKLLDRELVKIGGRAELPGRPLLYETTDIFYEHFGIKSIDDLPNAGELRNIQLPEAEEEQADSGSAEEENKKKDPEKQLVLSAVGKPPENDNA